MLRHRLVVRLTVFSPLLPVPSRRQAKLELNFFLHGKYLITECNSYQSFSALLIVQTAWLQRVCDTEVLANWRQIDFQAQYRTTILMHVFMLN